ncbi:MAG: hypothetical protein EDM70_00585 [Candidatus Brocadia sp. AMX2]|nr:MAG: hypothetical protein EDM70_00585 [Candidatus Brocadia sp. AMX2]
MEIIHQVRIYSRVKAKRKVVIAKRNGEAITVLRLLRGVYTEQSGCPLNDGFMSAYLGRLKKGVI